MSSPSAPDNASAIGKILSRTEVISIGGIDLHLSVPSHDVVLKLREQLMALGAEVERTPAETMTINFDFIASCIWATLTGIPEANGESRALLTASGGEASDLAAASVRLCGFSSMFAGNIDPLSESGGASERASKKSRK